MRENLMSGLMRGRWKPLSAVVMHPLQWQSNGYPRRVRRGVRERLQARASALLYPTTDAVPPGRECGQAKPCCNLPTHRAMATLIRRRVAMGTGP